MYSTVYLYRGLKHVCTHPYAHAHTHPPTQTYYPEQTSQHLPTDSSALRRSQWDGYGTRTPRCTADQWLQRGVVNKQLCVDHSKCSCSSAWTQTQDQQNWPATQSQLCHIRNSSLYSKMLQSKRLFRLLGNTSPQWSWSFNIIFGNYFWLSSSVVGQDFYWWRQPEVAETSTRSASLWASVSKQPKHESA